jgi:hypothetical protein
LSNWTLKYHLVKLVNGLINKTTQSSQIGQWLNQKGQLQILILVGYLGTTFNILNMFDQLEKKLKNGKMS